MISVNIDFEMAHRVADFSAGEANIHGHSWNAEVAIAKLSDGSHLELDGDEESLNDEFTLDPSIVISVLVEQIQSRLHNTLMISSQDEMIDLYRKLDDAGVEILFVGFQPTPYNIARYIYNEIEGELLRDGMHCDYVKLTEGKTSTALYTEYTN